LDYFVVQLPNRDELARVTNRVKDAGIEMEETEEGLLARDPSQNGIVLHAEEKN
ncbi:MAG: hypothetical protein HY070_03545, partial [Chloroflexi bacterium]|nr:hypothetical protein [Chloroflexota bacterium]